MPENNFAAIEARHLTAARWERIRSAYFERLGKEDNAMKCKFIAWNHIEAARKAAADARRAGK